MGLPATDAFTGTNGTALQTYSASWTINGGAFDIQSNAAHTNSVGAHTLAHWNADSFSNDQYAQLTVSAIAASSYIGPACRCDVSAHTGYKWVATTNQIVLQKVVAGAATNLTGSPVSTTINVNDVLRLEVVGSTIKGFVNGVLILAATDTAGTSGWAGIGGFGNGASNGDDWEGGNLVITTHQGLRRTRGGLDAR